MRPLVPSQILPPSSVLSWFVRRELGSIDGMRPALSSFVSALERLTHLSDLRMHTFEPWAPVFSHARAGLLCSPYARWCARCLECWHCEGVEPWVPLLWRTRLIACCPLHGVALSERCPSCERRLPLISNLVSIGSCSQCGHLLHRSDPTLSVPDPLGFHDGDDARFAWWRACALGQMLCAQRLALSHAGDAGFASLIGDLCLPPGPGASRLSRYLRVLYSTIARWRLGRSRPSFGLYLDVCLRLGESPAEIALGSVRSFPAVWRAHAPPWGRSSSSVSPSSSGVLRRRLRAALRQAIDSGESSSLRAFARAHNVTPRALARQFPDLYPVLAERDRRRLRVALRHAVEHGTFLSAKGFASAHGTTLHALSRGYPDLYPLLVEKAAAQRAAARRAASARYDRALRDALSAPEPRSVSSVARSVGVSIGHLYCVCPDLCVRLAASNRQRARIGRAARTLSGAA